jgi:uncharacterized protein (TIRG00374 family)
MLYETLARLTIPQAAFLLLVNTGIFFLFTFRWWWILRGQGYKPPFLHLVRYRLTAFGITYFTPGPQFGGEPYQVYALHKVEEIPISASVSSVSLDKLAELLANFSFLLIGVVVILRFGFFPALGRVPILPMVMVMLALPIIYLVALWFGRLPLTAISRVLRPKKTLGATVQKVLLAIESAEVELANTWRQQPGLLLIALLISMVSWLALILEYRLALQYLGLSLPWPQTIGVLTGARLAFLFPLPGGIGTLEASQIMAMQALGASTALGVSLSVLIRARDVLFGGLGLALGRPFLSRGRDRSSMHDRLAGAYEGQE